MDNCGPRDCGILEFHNSESASGAAPQAACLDNSGPPDVPGPESAGKKAGTTGEPVKYRVWTPQGSRRGKTAEEASSEQGR